MRWIKSRWKWVITPVVVVGWGIFTAKLFALLGVRLDVLMSASDNASWQSMVSALGALGAGAASSGMGGSGDSGTNSSRNTPTGGSGKGQHPGWHWVPTDDQGFSPFPHGEGNEVRPFPVKAGPMIEFSQWLQRTANSENPVIEYLLLGGPASGTRKSTTGGKA